MGTNDGRLIALDARDGKPCADFGSDPKHPGEVDAGANRPLLWPGEFQITSPPVVSHGLVIIGSAISDNRRADAPKGTVRAFDARSGAAKWNFDPVARRSEEHTSELPSLMRISYAVFCLKKKIFLMPILVVNKTTIYRTSHLH